MLAVYLLHYAADRAQLDAMARVIAQHLRPGGRLLTYQMNPDIARENSYYEQYGLRLAVNPDLVDGQRMSFKALIGDAWTPPITAYEWTRASITDALQQAGLTDVRWHDPTVDPRGIEKYGAAHWQAYLDHPHCLLLEAHKP